MAQNMHLVVIDPQNSFCKVLPPGEDAQTVHDGELLVNGAWQDMERVGGLMDRLGKKINQCHITMDSHHRWHIAHPCWFRDPAGRNPDPFTVMRLEKGNIIGSKYDANGVPHDVGNYTPAVFGKDNAWTYKYLEDLVALKRYPHVIWPYHCLIGTPGHNVVKPVMDAIFNWEQSTRRTCNKVTKGSCIYAEHFSAVKAEVPHPDYPDTQMNSPFITMLGEADIVVIAGEALSHCVANTFRDIAAHLGVDFVKKCVLLSDGSSNVTGFEKLGESFVKDMVADGMRVTTTKDFLA